MKSIVIFAIGLYVGRELQRAYAGKQNSQQGDALRERLHNFLTERQAGLSSPDVKAQVDQLLNGN